MDDTTLQKAELLKILKTQKEITVDRLNLLKNLLHVNPTKEEIKNIKKEEARVLEVYLNVSKQINQQLDTLVNVTSIREANE